MTGTGNEACQITFFFDEACTQPAVLKNAGDYYVRIYRPADAEYNEYKTEKGLRYTIELFYKAGMRVSLPEHSLGANRKQRLRPPVSKRLLLRRPIRIISRLVAR